MPKIGMEKLRKKALIDAAISAIHDDGYCHVVVNKIAKRAGVSSGLAHHYFGSKNDLLAATMQSLLTDLANGVRSHVKTAKTPREKISAIIAGNFSTEQFQPAIVSAWLAFYVQAQSNEKCRRLLRIYVRRLTSNLCFYLKKLTDSDAHAYQIAEGIAAMIDGFYIRRSLKSGPARPSTAIQIIEEYIHLQLGNNNE